MDNSVFISYRRNASGYFARAVYENLRDHGINVFMDVESINQGQFDSIILNQIGARPYFLIILSPGSLDRCSEPGDWLRREIEYAMEKDRKIIPVTSSTFEWRGAREYLLGKLAELPRYNAVNVPYEYFDEAMERLRTKFLMPLNLPSTPAPTADLMAVQRKLEEANAKPAVTKRDLTAQEYFDRGLKRQKQNDLEGAIDDYNQAISLNPLVAVAYRNRGVARYNKGDRRGAVADWNEAIRLAPDLPDAYINRGIAFLEDRNVRGAVADFSAAIGVDPASFAAYRNRGLARRQLGDLAGAHEDFTEVIRLNPQSADAYSKRGLLREQMGNTDGAIADWTEAIRLDSHRASTYTNRGVARYAKGDLDGAIEDFTAAILQNPRYAPAYRNRGTVRDALGDMAGAAKDYRRALELRPGDPYADAMLEYIAGWEKVEDSRPGV